MLLAKLLEYAGLIKIAAADAVDLGDLDPLKGRDFSYIVGKIADFLLLIGAPIAALMALYAAFQMITAGGNSEKFKSGMKTLLYAAIGFVVLLMAEGIANVIQKIFTG